MSGEPWHNRGSLFPHPKVGNTSKPGIPLHAAWCAVRSCARFVKTFFIYSDDGLYLGRLTAASQADASSTADRLFNAWGSIAPAN